MNFMNAEFRIRWWKGWCACHAAPDMLPGAVHEVLERLLKDPIVVGRTLHASDFPFPSNPAVFWNRLHPVTLLRLLCVMNPLKRDWVLKRALGLPTEVFSRANKLLADTGDGQP
jgi:hypothetical protein